MVINTCIGATIECNYPNEVTRRNIETVQRLLAYGDQMVVAHHDEFFCDEVRVHNDLNPYGDAVDRAAVEKYDSHRIGMLLAEKYEIINAFAFDDIIVAFLRFHGTHVGEFEGLSPTMKACSSAFLHMYRFRDGKICEVWTSWDRLHLLKQLGEVQIIPQI